MMQSFAVVTLGCKTNQFESAAIREQMLQAGYRSVPFEEGADLVIVNTCTVTANTDSQSRNLIRRARRLNDAARVVVTGCYAQVDASALAGLPGVALIVGNQEKEDFLSRLTALDDDVPRIQVSDIRAAQQAKPLPLTSFDQRSRAFVQIQNGCDAFCSYCIIPYARGRSRSVSLPDVVSQVERLIAAGYPEIVLTGIHIGGYGQDLTPATSLLNLLKQLRQETGVQRLRLGSIEPTELPDQFLDYVTTQAWICPHFHIPLQSGCDAVLERMNRHYSSAYFKKLLQKIRARRNDAAIGLDLIVGFPGETDAEFEQTCDLLRELPVTHLHVFPYSQRPGTPAAGMPGQVAGDIRKQRAAVLRQIGAQKQAEFLRTFVGKTVEVVVEHGESDGQLKGLSAHYLPVLLTDARPGELVEVQVSTATSQGLYGTPLRSAAEKN
ncbi:MAG: tRNA (N(6)-L-threonylcarbamoyladenosine(37)-C(2))-methylthiotransferase MtaB [Desulfuromonas sp.]|nr:MAG: tRNA (N(6)-L-threonylcarbamoyladenosine(37)-C(2))-methylthiotransferase MtaB [Desulfuromonas sp.]